MSKALPVLRFMEGEFVILRLPPDSPLPGWLHQQAWYSVTRTKDELSLVLPCVPGLDQQADDAPRWAMFMVQGPLDFSLTGILAELSGCLAAMNIPIFAISTFDTDYVLVPHGREADARQALQRHGYPIT